MKFQKRLIGLKKITFFVQKCAKYFPMQIMLVIFAGRACVFLILIEFLVHCDLMQECSGMSCP